jgi:hypothetical protein
MSYVVEVAGHVRQPWESSLRNGWMRLATDVLLLLGRRLREMYDAAAAPVPERLKNLLDDLCAGDRTGADDGYQPRGSSRSHEAEHPP